MVVHILKLIKSRLGSYGWILVELTVVFIVLWFMTGYFLAQAKLVNEPVGFSLDHVYLAKLAIRPANSPSFIPYEEASEEPVRNVERIVERLRRHPDVQTVALSYYSLPYSLSNIGNRVSRDSVRQDVRSMIVSPEYFRVFGIGTAMGESPEHLGEILVEARKETDLVISADLATRLFGHTDVLGAELHAYGDSLPRHVVAVTEPVRNSEYDRRYQYSLFSNLDVPALAKSIKMDEGGLTQLQIVFRTRPGVPTSDYADNFLKEMKRQLMVGNFWVSEVVAYTDLRATYLANAMETNSRRLVSALGAFFLLNVFLAVIGTFWFHVRRRRAELGLRMAMGSTHVAIQGLMIGEGLLLLAIASVPALLICANLAWADLLPGASVGRFLLVSLLTGGILALVIILATWYPARKASRLEPADALRYDG